MEGLDMNRYRIRLDSKRVIGPFNIKDYAELVKKYQLTGMEEYQLFPAGDWVELSEFSELEKIFDASMAKSNEDATFMANLKDLIDPTQNIEIETEEVALPKENQEKPKEFEFEHVDPFEGVSFADDKEQESDKETPSLEADDNFELDHGESLESEEDKTVIRKNPVVDTSDKTVINPDYQKYLQQKLKEEEAERKRLEEEEKRKKIEEQIEIHEPDYNNDKTEFIQIKDVKSQLESALEIEEDFRKIEKKKKQKKKVESLDVPVEEENQGGSRKKYFVLAITLVAFYFFLFGETEEKKTLKKITFKDPTFSFPMRNPVIDQNKAKRLYLKGVNELKLGKYPNFIKASKYFAKSLEFNFDGNDAAAQLIWCYSILLENSPKINEDIKIVYKLVQYYKKNSYTNPSYATAIANFYYVAGKTNAALNILERYLALESNKPSKKLYSVYLRSLLKLGDAVRAQSTLEALEKQDNKNFFIVRTMYEFYKDQNLIEKQLDILRKVQSLASLKSSVFFLLEKAELFLKDGDIKELQKILFNVNQLNAESSRRYYARYLKLSGLYYAAKKNYKKSVTYVKKSMETYELPELVGDLAVIEQTSDNIVNDMILLSRVKVLNDSVEEKLDLGQLNEAFKLAVRANEILPDNIETLLLLAKIQIQKGYYDDALSQIKKLYNKTKRNINKKVLYQLVDLYIEMYKFREAELELQNVNDKSTWEYASARAKMYRFKGEFNLAINWLVKAINLNQLDEKNIFDLAKFYMKFYKFTKAKVALTRVMDLDPYNIEYKITYAQILYEVETAASAIGYLYDVLKDFPDQPRILSEIGIYYYKSGQIKNYENIKKKLTENRKEDNNLYKFLVESAKLDGDFEKIVKFSKKILEINPGDLKTRIYLAEIYIELKRFKESKDQLDEIKKRFDSYPRLNYFYAKFFLMINEIDKAIELAEAEYKQNPRVVDGILLLGDIYKKEGKIFKARSYYLKASQVDPKSIDAILGLAYVAFKSNQYDLAIDQYEKAISIDETRADTYKLLGDVYRKLSQSQPAVKNYKQFLELSPKSRYKQMIEDYIRKVD